MINSTLENDLWPMIFKTLSDKTISYAVTPNTYPKVKEWEEHHHKEISIMLEDPNRPHKYGGNPLFSCWIVFKQFKFLSAKIDLSVYMPKAVDIKEILAIMSNDYFQFYPKLMMERDPYLGRCYAIEFEFPVDDNGPGLNYGPNLKNKLTVLDDIVQTLYLIEKYPNDKSALTKLTDLLLEMQC